jgi:hypothetical protein
MKGVLSLHYTMSSDSESKSERANSWFMHNKRQYMRNELSEMFVQT